MRWPPKQKGGNAHQRRTRRRFRERMHRRSFEALRALYGPSVHELVPLRPVLGGFISSRPA